MCLLKAERMNLTALLSTADFGKVAVLSLGV